jgi:hypothetical protein
MRWSLIIRDVALVIAVWVAVLWTLRRRRTRLVSPGPREIRSYRLQAGAAITVTTGVTWFVAWLASDVIGPHWLHTLSLPATLIFIAVGAVLAGYAGWIGGP